MAFNFGLYDFWDTLNYGINFFKSEKCQVFTVICVECRVWMGDIHLSFINRNFLNNLVGKD
jgi:hypothetical protein